MCADDVANLVVEDRCWMIELAFLRGREHQPDPTRIEEREIRRSEQKLEAEHVAIERRSARDILHVDRDLSDAVELYTVAHHFHLRLPVPAIRCRVRSCN